MTVSVGIGQVLVAQQSRPFSSREFPTTSNSGLLDVRYDNGSGPNTDLTAVISSGRLKGFDRARDTTAAGLRPRSIPWQPKLSRR